MGFLQTVFPSNKYASSEKPRLHQSFDALKEAAAKACEHEVGCVRVRRKCILHGISVAFTEHNGGDKPDCRDTWLRGCFWVCYA